MLKNENRSFAVQMHWESVNTLLKLNSTISAAPCGLLGCKNRPAAFPGWMWYKATKPGLVLFYILACFNCIVAY